MQSLLRPDLEICQYRRSTLDVLDKKNQDRRNSLVARKLVPTPTKKLKTTGTAKFALTCMLHPTMRVAIIVTLHISFVCSESNHELTQLDKGKRRILSVPA